MAETVGEISNFNSSFEWSVPDFFSRPEKPGEYCTSPQFVVDHESWVISLYPNGNKSPEYVSLYLKALPTNGNKFTHFKLGIKSNDRSQHIRVAEHLFSEEEKDWGWHMFMKRSTILNEKTVMAPANVLTICCTISSEQCAAETAGDTLIQVHRSRGGPSSRHKILWSSLSCNLKDLFLSRTNSDVIIKVKGEEFPVHRLILSSRSTVFAAMFEHKMVENISGIVELPDANPAIFRDLLLYMYSGEVKTLSSENVYDLYTLSDKYNLKDLKEECTSFMECTLSVDTVCDVLLLAENYNEAQLKESAEEYFVKNVAEVMKSDQWKTFESENPLLVIQLLKSIVLDKVSK